MGAINLSEVFSKISAMKISKNIKLGPWFWNTLLSTLFTAVFSACCLHTEFATLVYYDISIVLLMGAAMGLMGAFLLKMHRGSLPQLEKRLTIPHATYICLLVLTICVAIGYCYIFVYKLALYGCDKAVEARDAPHMALDSTLRIGIAAFAPLAFVYIGQRSYIGSLNTGFDIFTRNFLNCVFAILWHRFVFLKGYFTIEQFCRDVTGVDSVIKDFCPPYIKRGFTCSAVRDLREEQRIWYRLHYGLLKSAVVTCAAELLPVLLVAHWLACGKAEKVVRKLTVRLNTVTSSCSVTKGLPASVDNFTVLTSKLAELEPESAAYQRLMTSSSSSSGSRSSPSIIPQHQSSSSSSDATSICSEATLMMASPWIRRCLRTLACCLAGMGIALWMMSFFNYIHDLHHSVYVQAQNGMEVFTACVQLAFFIILFRWVNKVHCRELDLHHRAESRGDRILIFGSLAFLTLESVCDVCELLFFATTGSRAHADVKVMDVMASMFTLAANYLEAFSLRKIIALKNDYLLQFSVILPFIVFGCTVYNFAYFAQTYFYIETQKHHLMEIITNLMHNNVFVLIGVLGRIFDTASYLYTFTCALCWVDVLMRYYHAGHFVLGSITQRCADGPTIRLSEPMLQMPEMGDLIGGEKQQHGNDDDHEGTGSGRSNHLKVPSVKFY